MHNSPLRIAVVGGAGHVGLPLSMVLAKNGFNVTIVDIDQRKITDLEKGIFPFKEEGGPELLKSLLGKNLRFTAKHRALEESDVIILTIGTPVDEHLNPDLKPVFDTIQQILPHLRNGQVVILRSTLFPGTSKKIYDTLCAAGLNVGVSFCPERIAQGYAIQELHELPQIISGVNETSIEVARLVFSTIAREVIELEMIEAEIAKLFTNTWRYIRFAVANQFYMMAQEKGMDFYRIREAMTRNYPRAADFPTAGFAAGPCLFKDTMQLAAFNRQNFALGNAAMLVNETLPNFLVDKAKQEHNLSGMRVGILGMTFKPNNDDNRESLAYKLWRLLQYENAHVLCTDPYIRNPQFASLEKVLDTSELIFIGCPHALYRDVDFADKKVIDCWGFINTSLKPVSLIK
ncbi:MAG TPA: nucleotide sugar dehydrogenase [Chlamydiales bacterium]|nr:nucleotide sugar dehydrogenase [Chlamydiales bacterium]